MNQDSERRLKELKLVEFSLQQQIYYLEQDIKEAIKNTNSKNNSDELDLNTKTDKITKKLDPESIDWKQYEAPRWCVPIKANVLDFDFKSLGSVCQFDVILMDPPWQLATNAPTRGVAIGYQQLNDHFIETLPIPSLQSNGFLFIWVINNKYHKAFQMFKNWGYHYVEDITWVKQTVHRRMAKGHGYYLQHAKETCLVGKKGMDPENCKRGIASDVIYSKRRGQSQKPVELYELIEQLVPDGKYLEIFGRKNNLRDYWVTIGNEL